MPFDTILHMSFALSACFSIENLSQFAKLRCASAMPFPGSVWHFRHDLSAIFITAGEIGLLTMPFFVDVWADGWLKIIEVRKTIANTAKERLIAFFINNDFKVVNEFSNYSKDRNLTN